MRQLFIKEHQRNELAQSSPLSAWQPISSAPKDGTRIMVYACAHNRHWFGSGYYFKGVPGDGEGWIAHSFYTAPENDSSGSFQPTHWMPLPAPPQEPT